MRTLIRVTTAALIACTQAPRAQAHPIVPDGVANEWVTREPAAVDSARIVRDRDEPAELVWRDRIGDSRGADDVTQLRVHGNPDGVGLLLRFAAPASSCAQLQIAFDLDRAATSGAPTFSSEPETRLRDDSRAEFFAIATSAGGVVRDASNAERARFGAAVGADGLELFIPWTAFGLARWPTGVRMTPALFCAPDRNTPVAPSDGARSAVIDALTDYGGPAASVRTTRDEIDDGILHHAFVLRFGLSGVIREGLHIQRLAPTATTARGGAWIELVNRSDEPIATDRHAIGDEPVPGGPDGLVQLPAGITVAAGGRLVIALDGARFRSAFGVGADIEMNATDPATPDAIALPSRGHGAISFDPAGDEIALFDEERTLVDVVNYNSGAYPMIRSFAPLANDSVISRSAVGLDIDDCALDFFRVGDVCATTNDCPDTQCQTCADRVCNERPDGFTCALASCSSARCVAGSCVARADAGCAPDAALIDAAADVASDGSERDAMADVLSVDAPASVEASADVTFDATPSPDVAVAPDALDADAVAPIDVSAIDAAPDHAALDARDPSPDAALFDATPDEGRPPPPACACRAPASRATPRSAAVALSLAIAAILRGLRARRRN